VLNRMTVAGNGRELNTRSSDDLYDLRGGGGGGGLSAVKYYFLCLARDIIVIP
jgi:hypothetical protein